MLSRGTSCSFAQCLYKMVKTTKKKIAHKQCVKGVHDVSADSNLGIL